MKNLLVLIFITICLNSSAQIAGERFDTAYHCSNGKILHPGDTLFFGTGSMPNGNFKYVYVPPSSGVSSSYSGLHSRIKFFKKQGNKNMGYKTIAIINTGYANVAVDIEQAIKANEIEIH
jgi:hypothetical protein